jgi:hypothetical protein
MPAPTVTDVSPSRIRMGEENLPPLLSEASSLVAKYVFTLIVESS